MGGRESDPFLYQKQQMAAKRGMTLEFDRRWKLCFIAAVENVSFGEKVFVVGNVKPLGSNQANRGRRMDICEGKFRCMPLEVGSDVDPIEYRYCKILDTPRSVKWEKCDKRVFKLPRDSPQGEVIELQDNDVEFD